MKQLKLPKELELKVDKAKVNGGYSLNTRAVSRTSLWKGESGSAKNGEFQESCTRFVPQNQCAAHAEHPKRFLILY